MFSFQKITSLLKELICSWDQLRRQFYGFNQLCSLSFIQQVFIKHCTVLIFNFIFQILAQLFSLVWNVIVIKDICSEIYSKNNFLNMSRKLPHSLIFRKIRNLSTSRLFLPHAQQKVLTTKFHYIFKIHF